MFYGTYELLITTERIIKQLLFHLLIIDPVPHYYISIVFAHKKTNPLSLNKGILIVIEILLLTRY